MSTKLFSCSLLLFALFSFVVAPPPPPAQIIVTGPGSPDPHHPTTPVPPQVNPFDWHDLLHSDYIHDDFYWFRVIHEPVNASPQQIEKELRAHWLRMGDVIQFTTHRDTGERLLSYYRLESITTASGMKFQVPKGRRPGTPEKMVVFENKPLNDNTEFLVGTWANIDITDLTPHGVLKTSPHWKQIMEIKSQLSPHSRWAVILLTPAIMERLQFIAAPLYYRTGPLKVPDINKLDRLPKANTVPVSWDVHLHGFGKPPAVEEDERKRKKEAEEEEANRKRSG